MQDNTLKSIFIKAIACFDANIGGFAALEINSMRLELEAMEARAAKAAKDADRHEQERLAREAGGKVVFALDAFADSLGFVQTDPTKHKRLPFERHEFAHMSRDWFLVDVSRAGVRLRVEVLDEPSGRSVLQRVHDGEDLEVIARELLENGHVRV